MTAAQVLYAMDDSPVGLAAWLLDHDARSYELIARAFAGHEEGLTRDDILDNITLYWLTNTAVSASRLYWETAPQRTDETNRLFRSHRRQDTRRRERISRRAIYGSAQLGRTSLSQAHSLQPNGKGRPLRGMGTATILFRGAAREFPFIKVMETRGCRAKPIIPEASGFISGSSRGISKSITLLATAPDPLYFKASGAAAAG